MKLLKNLKLREKKFARKKYEQDILENIFFKPCCKDKLMDIAKQILRSLGNTTDINKCC